jgi:tetratricopeptide (TPR) repeat protein
MTRVLSVVVVALALAACAERGPARPSPGGEAPGGTVQPGNPQPQSPGPLGPSGPGQPSAPSARQFHLGPAATALVAQAHAQAASGEYPAAGATLERALRIEPENPLLWVELGRLQLQEHNAGQADGMGHKALALATGDPSAQASAWRLIADALREEGRNPEAADADRQAAGLVPR